MRVLAIDDIHGCATAFDALLVSVDLRFGDTLVTLGDYVDKGRECSAVLDRLVELHAKTSHPHQSGKTLICGHTAQKSATPSTWGTRSASTPTAGPAAG